MPAVPWLYCPACRATWPSDGSSTCICSGSTRRQVVHRQCGHPVSEAEHLAWLREKNRQRAELALAFKIEAGGAEKYLLTSCGSGSGSMSPTSQCEGCGHGADRICLLGRLVFPGEWCDWRVR